jgi:hypothetical protein
MLQRNRFFVVALTFLMNFSFLSTDQFSDQVYQGIKDLANPSYEDYKAIETYLKFGFRPYIDRLDPWQYKEKARSLKLLPEDERTIQHHIVSVNCDPNDRENCLILYTTYNFNYPECLLKLVNYIKNSDFKGHIIYRIGGWPNVEDGDLELAHIPYAFKVSAFREAYRLGFKQALWLDSPMRPTVSLNSIFKQVKRLGFFGYQSTGLIDDFISPTEKLATLKALEITSDEAKKFYRVVGGILGIDFTNPTALEIFNRWYYITKYREQASFSYRQEATIIAVILNRYFNICPFKDRQQHINCEDPSTNEFNFSKIEAQPNWPN